MKIEDLLALTKAGWSKEEIIKLSLAEQEAPKEAEENIPIPKEEAPIEAPKEEAPKEDPASAKIDDVIAKLETLASGMEKMAIQNSRLPERETVDDILASIINPTK